MTSSWIFNDFSWSRLKLKEGRPETGDGRPKSGVRWTGVESCYLGWAAAFMSPCSALYTLYVTLLHLVSIRRRFQGFMTGSREREAGSRCWKLLLLGSLRRAEGSRIGPLPWIFNDYSWSQRSKGEAGSRMELAPVPEHHIPAELIYNSKDDSSWLSPAFIILWKISVFSWQRRANGCAGRLLEHRHCWITNFLVILWQSNTPTYATYHQTPLPHLIRESAHNGGSSATYPLGQMDQRIGFSQRGPDPPMAEWTAGTGNTTSKVHGSP